MEFKHLGRDVVKIKMITTSNSLVRWCKTVHSLVKQQLDPYFSIKTVLSHDKVINYMERDIQIAVKVVKKRSSKNLKTDSTHLTDVKVTHILHFSEA